MQLVIPCINWKRTKGLFKKRNQCKVWKSCHVEEGPVDNSVFPYFISPMLHHSIWGASEHDRESRRHFMRILTPFHPIIKRSFELSYSHLGSCSNVRKALHKIMGWYHICRFFPSCKKHRHCCMCSVQ